MGRRRGTGFTLIELMIVIAIIAILADILVPNFIRAKAQGMYSACESNEKNIGTGLEMYAVDHKGTYPFSMQRLTPNYLRVIPTCPTAGTDTYSATFTRSGGIGNDIDNIYTFYCNGANHVTVGVGSNFPEYNSLQGLVSGH